MPRDSNAPPPAEPRPPPKPQERSGAGAAAAIGAAVLVAAQLAAHFEGYRSKAYYDPAHILTVCYGETAGVDPSRVYSKDQCAAQLRGRMAADYAPALIQCLPGLKDPARQQVFGALLDAAYNAGPAAVCKSRMAASIRAGDWAGACAGFPGWYTTALNRKTGVRTALPGLVKRRNAEAATCAAPAQAPAPVVQPARPTAPTAPPPQQPSPVTAPSSPSLLDRIEHFFGHLFGASG